MTITSDQNLMPPARHLAATVGSVPAGGQALDRGTAMLLADNGRRPRPARGHRVWPRIPGWAGEPGLTAPGAITRAPRLPRRPATKKMQPAALTPKPDYDRTSPASRTCPGTT